MRVLVCVDTASVERLLDLALAYVPQPAEWLVVHVIDTRGRLELGVLRGSVPGSGPLGPRQREAIETAATDYAQALTARVQTTFDTRNLRLESVIQRTGEPGREICEVARESRADLVVVRARDHPAPPVGPPSVGHTARFVLDHAPCPVLLLRAH